MPLTEQTLLAIARRTLAQGGLLHDDAFVDEATGLVLATDMLVENQHFKHVYSTAEDIAWKTVAVNVSDMIAMGAKPRYGLLSMALPPDTDEAWVTAFFKGLDAASQHYHIQVIGGDTVGGPVMVLNLAMTGERQKHITWRHTAEPGDIIYTSHPQLLGLARLGLEALETGNAGQWPEAVAHHRRPAIDTALGLAMGQLDARITVMDTSDGLGDALAQIAALSKVQLTIQAAALVPHPELHAWAATKPAGAMLERQLYGGEDFTLLACAAPEVAMPAGFVPIGHVAGGEGAYCYADGNTLPISARQAWQHF